MSDTPENPTRWLSLSQWTLMTVTGPQAQKFLQGQVTCDVNALEPGISRLGAHCTPKGRMVFSFRALARDPEHFMLRLPTAMVERAQATLGKYVVFSRAELAAAGEQWALRGIVGPEARALLTQHLMVPATEPGDWVEQNGQFLITLGENRFECWLTPERAETLDGLLADYHESKGDHRWVLEDIRAGLGEVGPETSEVFTPQALNFPSVGAVSFKKGCYTGQEVVARLHYKGKLKRRMRRLSTDWSPEQPLPAAGQPLTDAEERKVGELVMAARNGDDQIECLAVLDDKALESARIPGSDSPARLLSLPYNVE